MSLMRAVRFASVIALALTSATPRGMSAEQVRQIGSFHGTQRRVMFYCSSHQAIACLCR